MKSKFMQTTVGTFLALLMLFGAAQIFVSGQESEQGDLREEQTERSGNTIVGVWRVALTPRNCQTGAPVAPTSRPLFTFHEGGTLSEYNAGPAQTPAMRSPGHGVWEQQMRGRQNYSLAFIINRYDASGVFIGTQQIRAFLELAEGGDSYTTNATVQTFDANDNLVGTGCATSVGTRFE
ncbi:MAG: hypothetical protein M3367_09315 [Acidobacteriota bacterium]|nr:hypothetical protein [Acidobacteriota bacterium]